MSRPPGPSCLVGWTGIEEVAANRTVLQRGTRGSLGKVSLFSLGFWKLKLQILVPISLTARSFAARLLSAL